MYRKVLWYNLYPSPSVPKLSQFGPERVSAMEEHQRMLEVSHLVQRLRLLVQALVVRFVALYALIRILKNIVQNKYS